MNKKDYKRYKKIRLEITQLNQDIDDTMNEIKYHYAQRDVQGAKKLNLDLSTLLEELYKREAIRDELLLPKYLKIEGGFKDIQDFVKDNDWDEDDTEELIEEYCSIFMLDNYNHTHFDFYYHVKGEDIYITNIRWNKKQMLPHDLKRLLKKEINVMENGYVLINRHPIFKGLITIYEKGSQMGESFSYKEAIEYLENHYYM